MFSIVSRLSLAAKSIFQTVFQAAPYWIEITTRKPRCLYYFGAFSSYGEAKQMQSGYVEDLIAEKAEGIEVQIKRCSPSDLTVMEEEFPA